jgi:ubiquinone/menaquinone biosynthesis C-methylase UbiE
MTAIEVGVRPVKLDIGGAASPYAPDEYTTVDIDETAEVVADCRALPFEDNSVDAIWASHILEHLPVTEIPVALAEWFRVLKPHARAIIRVPNFDYVAKYWLTGSERGWAEAMVFGLQTSEGEFHKSAHTAGSIKADVEAAGFECLRVEMRWTHNQETLQAVARKPA